MRPMFDQTECRARKDNMFINWNEFETLMDAAIGDPPAVEKKNGRGNDLFLRNVVIKRKALEEQQSLFTQATEDTILQEYQKLRRAHREFISTFEEAKSAYTQVISSTRPSSK